MNKVTLALATANMEINFKTDMENLILNETKDFVPTTSDNKASYAEQEMYKIMFRHEILSKQKSYINKRFEGSKKALDRSLELMEFHTEPLSGNTIELYSTNGIKFSKKCNNPTTTISSTDLLIQLARLGVVKSVIDEAVKLATKEKRGNTYYMIEAV